MAGLQLGGEFEDLGRQLLELAEQTAAAQGQIDQAARQLGACWGNDEPGRQFAGSYVPDAEQITQMAQNLIDQLRQYGSNVIAATQNLAAQDAQSAAGMGAANSPSAPSSMTPTHAARPGTTSGAAPQNAVSPPQNAAANPASPAPTGGQPGASPAAEPGLPELPSNGPHRGAREREDPNRPNRVSAPVARQNDAPRTSRSTPGRTAEPSHSEPPSGPTGPVTPKNSPARPVTASAKPVSSTPDSMPPPTRPQHLAPKEKQPDKEKGRREKKSAQKKRPWEELSEKYGIELVGFDMPEASESALAEIAAAVEAILARYPFARLRRLAIVPLPEGEWTRVSWVPGEQDEPVADEVSLAATMVCEPLEFATRVTDAVREGFVTRASASRPIFAAAVRALGSVVDIAGGFAARGVARRALVSAYVPMAPSDSIGQVVGGFREWRSRLSGCCFHEGSLNPGPALAEGFTETELLGEGAQPAAQVLHAVLVGAALEKVQVDAPTAAGPPLPPNEGVLS